MTWAQLLLAAACSTVVSIGGVAAVQALRPRPEPPAMIYCSTGAGPLVVDGYDWQTRVHPLFSDVWVLQFTRHPRDGQLQSIALQPPFECGEIGARTVTVTEGKKP